MRVDSGRWQHWLGLKGCEQEQRQKPQQPLPADCSSYKLSNFELVLSVQFSFSSLETVTDGSLL